MLRLLPEPPPLGVKNIMPEELVVCRKYGEDILPTGLPRLFRFSMLLA